MERVVAAPAEHFFERQVVQFATKGDDGDLRVRSLRSQFDAEAFDPVRGWIHQHDVGGLLREQVPGALYGLHRFEARRRLPCGRLNRPAAFATKITDR